MKTVLKKISKVLKKIFGWGITVALFGGGLSFFGYVAALIIGGPTAAEICTFLYKKFLPVMIYISTAMILLGVIAMYLAGEKALATEKKKAAKPEGEK